MKKRLLTSLEIVLTLALAFVLKQLVSDYFFDALILFIVVMASIETSRVFTKMGKYNYFYLVVAMPVVFEIVHLIGVNFDSSLGFYYTLVIDVGVMLVAFLCAFLFGLVTRKTGYNELKIRKIRNSTSLTKYSLTKAFNTLVAFIYPTLLLSLMTFLNHFDKLSRTFPNLSAFDGQLSFIALLFMFLIPIFTDTFAYVTGSLFGGKKLAPAISPNKTIAGSIGGSIFAVLLSACVYLIMDAIDYMHLIFEATGFAIWQMVIIAFIGSIICQFGDLFESFLKRKADIKDSGKIFPGHGGMLDRVDSYIFLVPFLLLTFSIILIV